MARAHRKKSAYDSTVPADAIVLQLLKAAGLPHDRRYSAADIEAIQAVPIEQLKRGGIHLVTHREKLKGSEDREIISKTMQHQLVQECLQWLHPTLQEAVSDFKALCDHRDGFTSPGYGDVRVDGSGATDIDADVKDLHERMMDYRKVVFKQINRKERRMLEKIIRYEDKRRIPIEDTFLIKSGAAKLAEFFEKRPLQNILK